MALMWKHGRWSLLRPVRADQSEQTVRAGRQALKRQTEGAWSRLRKTICHLKIKTFLAATRNKRINLKMSLIWGLSITRRSHVRCSSDDKQRHLFRVNRVSVLDSGFSCSPLRVKKLGPMLAMTNQTTASVFSLSPWKADETQWRDRGKMIPSVSLNMSVAKWFGSLWYSSPKNFHGLLTLSLN